MDRLRCWWPMPKAVAEIAHPRYAPLALKIARVLLQGHEHRRRAGRRGSGRISADRRGPASRLARDRRREGGSAVHAHSHACWPKRRRGNPDRSGRPRTPAAPTRATTASSCSELFGLVAGSAAARRHGPRFPPSDRVSPPPSHIAMEYYLHIPRPGSGHGPLRRGPEPLTNHCLLLDLLQSPSMENCAAGHGGNGPGCPEQVYPGPTPEQAMLKDTRAASIKLEWWAGLVSRSGSRPRLRSRPKGTSSWPPRLGTPALVGLRMTSPTPLGAGSRFHRHVP